MLYRYVRIYNNNCKWMLLVKEAVVRSINTHGKLICLPRHHYLASICYFGIVFAHHFMSPLHLYYKHVILARPATQNGG